MRFTPFVWAMPALLSMACGDKSAVSLSADISEATIKVRDDAFGNSSLTGTFTLRLTLGPEAAGPTTVTLGNFSLNNARGASLVDALDVASQTSFPLVLSKGSTKDVTFTLSAGAVEATSICSSDSLRVVGAVMDTLKGGTDPVQSLPIMPDCNPD